MVFRLLVYENVRVQRRIYILCIYEYSTLILRQSTFSLVDFFIFSIHVFILPISFALCPNVFYALLFQKMPLFPQFTTARTKAQKQNPRPGNNSGKRYTISLVHGCNICVCVCAPCLRVDVSSMMCIYIIYI